MSTDEDGTLRGVGPRLRTLRSDRGTTLAALSTATGISVSTLSRLESGQRRPTLELLLPLARTYGVTIDPTASPSTNWWAGRPRVIRACTCSRSNAAAP